MPDIEYTTTASELTSIADAIRTKGGTSASLVYPTGFVSAIENLPSGGGGTVQKTCTVTIDSTHVVCSNFSSGAPSGTYAAIFELPNSWDASNKQVGIFVACNGGVDSTDTNTNSALFVNDPSTPMFGGLVSGNQAYALAYNDDFLGSWVDSSYNTLGIVGTYTATVIEL